MKDRMEKLKQELISAGVQPNFLGQTEEGVLFEYRSLPWFAGKDFFVLVQEPDKPDTLNCIELRLVKPLKMVMEQNVA